MKYRIIPKGSEKPFQKLLLAWHTGIDAVEIADGNFIVGEVSLQELAKYPTSVTIASKLVSVSTELQKLPLVDEKSIIFKTTTIDEKVIIKSVIK